MRPAPSSNSPVNSLGKDSQKAVEAHHQAMKVQETHVRGATFAGAGSIWKAFPVSSNPPVPSCAMETQPLSKCMLLACAY